MKRELRTTVRTQCNSEVTPKKACYEGLAVLNNNNNDNNNNTAHVEYKNKIC